VLTSIKAAIEAAIEAKYPSARVKRASTETDGKSADVYEAKVTKSDRSPRC